MAILKYKDKDTQKWEIVNSIVTGDTLPIGAIIPYSSDNIPDNWLLADGRAVSRTTYKKLFNVIGVTYGSGDGSTTFNLPNLKGKIPVGQDEDSLEFAPLAMEGGEKTHTLTIEEMPSHTHTFGVSSVTGGQVQNQPGYGGSLAFTQNVGATGGSQPHNNLQPYLVTNYIIKAAQSSGLVATVVNNLESDSETNALSAKQGKELNKKIIGTVLFDNPNGDNTNQITLNQSVSEFHEVKIDYAVAVGGYTINESKRVPIKDGNYISLTCFSAHSDIVQLLDIGRYLFSGNTVTRVHETRSRISSDNTTKWDGPSTGIYITKVIGYKY